MKAVNFVKLAVAALLILGLVSSNAIAAETATGNATAEIVNPIKIEPVASDMNFGGIVPGSSKGSVVLDASGGVTSGNHTLINPSVAEAGDFIVSGIGGALFTPSLTDAVITLTHSTISANTMSAELVISDTGSTTTPFSGAINLDSGGSRNITVHGALGVDANQVVGTYNGTYTINVVYN